MQINIAFCEDVSYDQDIVKKIIERWALQKDYRLNLAVFADTNKLLGEIDNAFDSFDIYLLDIEMRTPKEGMELARIIRKYSKIIPIIFITSHREFSYEGYEVQALHFISKPIDGARLLAALDIAANHIEQRKVDTFICNIDGAMRRFYLYDIRYLENLTPLPIHMNYKVIPWKGKQVDFSIFWLRNKKHIVYSNISRSL